MSQVADSAGELSRLPPLGELIGAVMDVDPDARALCFEGRWYSWGDLTNVGDEIRDALEAASVKPDEAVAIVMRNHAVVVAAVLAVVRERRCVLSMSALMPDTALCTDVAACRPAAILALSRDWERPGLKEAAGEAGSLGIELVGDAEKLTARPVAGLEHDASASHRRVEPGTIASMLTSGTTGSPKRVEIAEEAIAQAIASANVHHEHRTGMSDPRLRDATSILDLPMFNIGAFGDVVSTVVSGRRMCLLERFDPWEWGRAVRDHRVVVALLVPATMRMVLDAGIPKDWLSSLRVVRTGSAPLDPALARRFEETYDLPIIVAYGATEFSGAIASLTMADLRTFGPAKRASVGRPHPGVEVSIVDPADGRALGTGEVGLLTVRSRQLVGVTEGAFIRTNDLARVDEDGFLYIEGRADDVIIRGGLKIDPREVEAALLAHPDVREASVVALVDERLGQVPAAGVVLRDGSDEFAAESLKAWLRERIAAYKVPTVVKVLDELPRTSSMKTARAALAGILVD